MANTNISITLTEVTGVTVTPKMKSVTVELTGTDSNIASWISTNTNNAVNYSAAKKTRKTVAQDGTTSTTDYTLVSLTYEA